MEMFLLGYAAAVVTYFLIGIAVGVYVVMTNLARFHGAGFHWRRMAGHVALVAVFWPGAILEALAL